MSEGLTRTEAIIFDVDGTLIDTYRLYLESYRRALEGHLGYVPEADEFKAHPPSSEWHFLAGWIGEEHADACHAAMCRHYDELHSGFFDGIYEGIPEMLTGLRSAGLPLGIVTGKGRKAWEVTLTKIELGDFEVVITENDAAHPKPHPAGLLAALASMRVEPAATVYIGDSATDMEAGRRAGMRIGAALWPKTASGEKRRFLEQIRPFEPDWTFDRPADVVRTFARWC